MNKVSFFICVYLLCVAKITTVTQEPAANFEDIAPGIEPYTVEFVNTSSGEIVEYLWNFGDGKTSELPNPTHTFLSAGTFNVSLTINGDTTNKMTKMVKVFLKPRLICLKVDDISDYQPFEVKFKNTSNDNLQGMMYTYKFWDGWDEHVFGNSDVLPINTNTLPNQHKPADNKRHKIRTRIKRN